MAEKAEESLREAKAALEVTPDNAEAHKNAGLALESMRKYEAAMAEKDYGPNNAALAPVLDSLAKAFHKMGRAKRTHKQWRNASETCSSR